MTREIDAGEFEELYLATVRDVLTYTRRRATADPEDLVAEVYTIAWRRRTELPPPLLRRAWLFGVARNLLIAASRQRARDGSLIDEIAAATGEVLVTTEPPSTKEQVVATAIERLAPADREILRLTAWEGLTPAEVAVVLSVRPATARVRLHRARRALASDKAVQALVEEPEPAVLAKN